MKITPVSALSTLREIKTGSLSTNPINNNDSYISPDKMFQMFFGRDLVSFKANNFQNTLKENYFHLPAGCSPDEFQIEAGKHLYEGKNVIVEAPTGTGKTAVGYYAASKNMAEGKTTFYTTPLKALSNQKLNEFKSIFGDENVGILTGDRRENVEAPIIIMTTEVYRNMALSKLFNKDTPLMDNLGTVILDECHYLGDPSRGAIWDESVFLTPEGVQQLALSATIGNSDSLTKWMNEASGHESVLVSIPESARNVPLHFDSILTNSYQREEKRLQKSLKKNGYISQDSTTMISSKPTLNDFKTVVDKLNRKDQLPAILFVFSRKFSRELLEYLGSEGQDLTNSEEKKEIQKILNRYKSQKYIGCDIDETALLKGYAIHNAGIIPAQKELIEELFQKKLIKTVIATETLAAGINMPAKTVVLSSPYKPDDSVEGSEEHIRTLSPNEFKQMSGRAGRRGIDTEGYVYTMPTDKTTEQEFLMLEAMPSNEIKSSYEPEYSFLTSFYQNNADTSDLRDIYSKSFKVYSSNPEEKEENIQRMFDISSRKSNVLQTRGFIDRYGAKTQVTPLGQLASVVKGYDALTLAEVINNKDFGNLSSESLAMVAAAIANPAKGKEKEIATDTDLSTIFDTAQNSVAEINKELTTSINSLLKNFGKTIDDFSSYSDLLEYAENIENPEVDYDEMKSELDRLHALRAKMYKITRTSGKYTIQDVVNALKKQETVPTKILEDYYKTVENYKKRINAKTIDDYIEKLRGDFERQNSEVKGKKAKARIERKLDEIRKDIEYAGYIKYLDENIMNAMAQNQDFLRHNPPSKIQNEYREAESAYYQLKSRNPLIEKVKGMIGLERYLQENDVNRDRDKNISSVQKAVNSVIGKSLDIAKTESENGIINEPQHYGETAAQIAYHWAYLNEINPDSMTNWMNLLNVIPETEADEGTIYRSILQTADLLSQINEMAKVGFDISTTEEDKKYYMKLILNSAKARNMLIKEPITV